MCIHIYFCLPVSVAVPLFFCFLLFPYFFHICLSFSLSHTHRLTHCIHLPIHAHTVLYISVSIYTEDTIASIHPSTHTIFTSLLEAPRRSRNVIPYVIPLPLLFPLPVTSPLDYPSPSSTDSPSPSSADSPSPSTT